ncbi:aspartyl protease family protein [Streptomyces sp. RFCAC02]|uniref:aspartyl protease family protein n=1 Tax=Streptomyces sp. RFCAC02 TaxID=2499143 RepID=UPI00101F0B6D|nr:aspartyl protease family protein [Streptomyces sp. RFCAC02]
MTPPTSRRAFLQRAGTAVAVGAALPLVGGTARAADAGADPDRLFTEGRFAEAERAYRDLLRQDSGNAHATSRVGYLALLSHRFRDAERYLSAALTLAPDDTETRRLLADCYARQDKFGRAAELLRGTGPVGEATAAQYDGLTGTPYDIRGASVTRVPFAGLDPLPHIEATVPGSAPGTFVLDTGGTFFFSTQMAEQAGLRALSSSTGAAAGQAITMYHGVLDSFRIGDVELRNVPVDWFDWGGLGGVPLPGGATPAGVIGTSVFRHFRTTLDYANQELVLRRKSSALPPAARRGTRLPLWLAGHMPCTLGSVNDYGPRVVSMDTGFMNSGFATTVANAERAGIALDYENPIQGGLGTAYAIVADRVGLGRAVGEGIRGFADETSPFDFPFDTLGNVTHEFFKPFTLTLDYADMSVRIA